MEESFSGLEGRKDQWRNRLAVWTAGLLLFESLSGLSLWLLPFSVINQVLVILHTAAGVIFLIPCGFYLIRHWLQYRRTLMTHVKLLGYLGLVSIAVAAISGLVLTVQAVFLTRISYWWDLVHLVSTFGVLAFVLPHIAAIPLLYGASERAAGVLKAAKQYAASGSFAALFLLGLVLLGTFAYSPVSLNNNFPEGYSFKYGEDRPFAPSLAVTETGGAFDPRSLAGSKSCGTAGCHVQIVAEWEPSAHRYSAMDSAFQGIQLNMARQNGSESTRYCGGCHDPISLFSGSKNIYTDEKDLTGIQGYQEGVSCLACHAVRETDIKGNAHYVVTSPPRYMFELEYDQSQKPVHRMLRDFLIRAYPWEHQQSLSKHLFKAPEYCAACHKQFIDAEINNVGWVQLQNQFDNWRMSRWNHVEDPSRTIECRECHMPLVDSTDPAAGDSSDYNRSPDDRKHRNHRFLASNQMMPKLLELPGWEKQVELTEQWLRGQLPIPEIEHKWSSGSAVTLDLMLPESASAGEEVTVRTVITSNKVGHDFPSGPLDIIQSWVELVVTDGQGKELYTTGRVDSQGFIQPGSFILKAEPVDQYGNLIDRHNLWEMVGVRHRRALFPGFADVADFRFFCPDLYGSDRKGPPPPDLGSGTHQIHLPEGLSGSLQVEARLLYRKIDQSLVNFIYGADAGLTSPITVMAVDRGQIPLTPSGTATSRSKRTTAQQPSRKGAS